MADFAPEWPPQVSAQRGDWRGRMYWLAGCVAGFIGAARTRHSHRASPPASDPWLTEWRRWLLLLVNSKGAEGCDFPGTLPLDPLRRVLLGRSRVEIVELLGPPHATSAQPSPAVPSAYWRAEVWYYPLDLRCHHAVAITFAEDVARSLDRLVGPG